MKYIVEIKPEYEDSFKGLMVLGAKDSNLFVDTLAVENLEELNSDYVNEHFGDLQEEAYQRGLNDAWEAARKIIRMPEGDMLDLFPECYSAVCTASQVVLKYDTSEAIAKLKAYEEQNNADEIKVGDEVKRKNAPESERGGIVTKDWGSSYFIMWSDGSSGKWDKDRVVKTGRRFEIDKILEAMKA